MFGDFYRALASIGYTDPIHAALVHAPIGLVVGALVFGFASLWLKCPSLPSTSRHCVVLALIFWFPTVVAGLMDWQVFYGGAWLFPIKVKAVCAVILLTLLCIAAWVRQTTEGISKIILAILALCLFTVTALGYFGARLTFAGKVPSAPEEYSSGRWLFRERCSSCHPNGGNIVRADMPLRGAPMLMNFTLFLAWIRNPSPPMPSFSTTTISDDRAKELFDFVQLTMR